MTDSFDGASPITAERAAIDPDLGLATDLVEHAAAFLSPDDLVLAIGLTSGEHASSIARRCHARVIVFEPDLERAVPLDQHIAREGLGDRVEVRTVALGAQTTHPAARGTSAPTVALDDVPLSSPPKLLTIGPAGSTVEILRGAEQLIGAHRPWVHVRTPKAAELGMALTLLGGWGYEPHGQLGPGSSLLCIPTASAAAVASASAEQRTAPGYSDLEAWREGRRQRPVEARDRPDDTLAANASLLIELTRQMERMTMMLVAQSDHSRRMEVQLVTLKRRFESLAAAGLPRKPSVPTQGPRSRITADAPSQRRITRKLRKLSNHPAAFFNDSKVPLLRFVGRALFSPHEDG